MVIFLLFVSLVPAASSIQATAIK